MTNFTLGTRGSLLAVTQSTLIKLQLEQLYPEHNFQLKTIKTQGDIVTNKPLWQLEGKDFFTKELDDALQSKSVDFVVHSCKDLSHQRPSFLKLAAITPRVFPHDILLITQNKLQQIQEKKISTIHIGTSSPRRQYLLQNELKQYLPFGEHLTIEFSNLRGNVNTRIEKLKSDQYDIICLAGAGLERLASQDSSNNELNGLLSNILIKFLPLSIFPSAPGQGALAIECLDENKEMITLLQKLNCEITTNEVSQERTIFHQYGGGCHLALGVYVKNYQDKKVFTLHSKGFVQNEHINQHQINNTSLDIYRKQIMESPFIFLGITQKRLNELQLSSKYLADEPKIINCLNNPCPENINNISFYLTSEHTIATFSKNFPTVSADTTLWTSGSSLHQKLSQLGYWITGDNDSLGIEFLKKTYSSQLSNYIFKNKQIVQLSFQGQTSEDFQTWETYSSSYELNDHFMDFKEKIKSCHVFFWTSSKQYNFYKEFFPTITHKMNLHFCGLGKTFDQLSKKSEIPIISVTNINQFIFEISKYT